MKELTQMRKVRGQVADRIAERTREIAAAETIVERGAHPGPNPLHP